MMIFSEPEITREIKSSSARTNDSADDAGGLFRIDSTQEKYRGIAENKDHHVPAHHRAQRVAFGANFGWGWPTKCT